MTQCFRLTAGLGSALEPGFDAASLLRTHPGIGRGARSRSGSLSAIILELGRVKVIFDAAVDITVVGE